MAAISTSKMPKAKRIAGWMKPRIRNERWCGSRVFAMASISVITPPAISTHPLARRRAKEQRRADDLQRRQHDVVRAPEALPAGHAQRDCGEDVLHDLQSLHAPGDTRFDPEALDGAILQ